MASAEPSPPDEIPQYIVDGLRRQDRRTLSAIETYVARLQQHLEALEDAQLENDELVEDDEELIDVEDSGDGTEVIKKVPCGKDCGGCPHGPYRYVVTRRGDSLHWEYKGRVETS